MTRHLLGCVPLALLCAACVSPPQTPPPQEMPDAGPLGPVVERFGDFLPTRTSSILTGEAKPIAILGRGGVVLEEQPWFGLSHQKNAQGVVIVSGLTMLDTSTGKARRLTTADGLPSTKYDVAGIEAGEGTVQVLDLTWITPDVSFAGAAVERVIRGQVDADGKWSFKSATVRKPGSEADAQIALVAFAGGDLFVGSDQGVAALSPDTLEVRHWIDLGTEEAPWIFGMSAGRVNGPAVAVMFGAPEQTSASEMRLLIPGSATSAPIILPNNMVPTMVQGLPEGMLVGGQRPDGKGQLYRVEENASQELVLALVATADDLNRYSPDGKPFVPYSAAFDLAHQRLYVGGAITSRSPGASGRLVFFGGTSAGEITTAAEPPFDRQDPYAHMLPWQVDLLHVDAHGRVYVAGRQLCSETKARAIGLLRIEEQDGERRLIRPMLSGIRTISVDPSGDTWLGMRDAHFGLTCDGYSVQNNICRLRADGSCEIYTPRVTAPYKQYVPTAVSPTVGATAIAFGNPDRRELAILMTQESTFFRLGGVTHANNTQYDPGVGLSPTSAAWDANGALWIGATARWEPQPNPADDDRINANSAQGLGYLEFDEQGEISTMRRYVRVASSYKPTDVAGMPSHTVLDVIPLPGREHALVAMGIERHASVYDHEEKPRSSRNVKGGLAEVNGTTISVIDPPAGVEWSDVVKLAQLDEQTFLALDAEAGVVKVDLATKTATLWAASHWGESERGRALAVDGLGRVAVGTTQGLYVYDANAVMTTIVSNHEHGQFWSARFMAEGLLFAGADQGLVRVALDPSSAVPALGPANYASREPWELDLGCYGGAECRCFDLDHCEYGLGCFSNYCSAAPNPCRMNPGSLGCGCVGGAAPGEPGACDSGLVCECEGTSCVCEATPCGGVAGCSCEDNNDCAEKYICVEGDSGKSCTRDYGECGGVHMCVCTEADDCAPGYSCDPWLGAGKRCFEGGEP